MPQLIVRNLAESVVKALRERAASKGRSTEAELAGVTGQDVLLRKSEVEMRWPLAKLSPADQAYVNEWQANPPITPKLGLQIWKKEGISPAGTFAEEPGGPDGLPNIPGLHEVKKKDTFHYFAVDITNPNSTQASLLTLSYQIYVIPTSGNVIVETATGVVPNMVRRLPSGALRRVSRLADPSQRFMPRARLTTGTCSSATTSTSSSSRPLGKFIVRWLSIR